MKSSITFPKYLLLVLLIFMLSCNSETKKQTNPSSNSQNDKHAHNAILSVIDSINKEINDGEYGLIDHFMVVHNEKILADFKYKKRNRVNHE